MRSLACIGILAGSLLAGPAVAASPTEVSYNFTLSPGGSKTIVVPASAGAAVELYASLSAHNGGTQTPTNVIGALMSQDTTSKQLTWIGTNGDGSQSVGNTINDSTVASFAFSNAVVTGAPGTADSGLAKLTFTQSSTQTSIPFTYYVRMIY